MRSKSWLSAFGLSVGLCLFSMVDSAPAATLDELERQAQKPPKEPDKLLELGRALRRAGLFGSATRVLRSGYALSRKGEIAILLRLEAVRSLIAAGDQKQALRECGSLKAVSEAKQSVCIAEAQLLWRRASLALPAAEKALELLPRDYDALVAKGRALAQMGQMAAAEAALGEAVAVDGMRPEGHRYLGELLLLNGRSSAAVAELRKAVQAAPEEAELLYGLAQALGNSHESRKLLLRSLEIRPDFGPAHAAFGALLLQLGDLTGAERALRTAIQHDARQADWHARLARTLLTKGESEPAIQEAALALKLVANHGQAKLVEADALAKRGDIDLAIEAYEAAFGFARNDPNVLVHAARACLTAKRPTTARAFAERATQTFAKWAPAWEVLGDVHALSNEKRAAHAAYQKALASEGEVSRAALRRKLARLR